LEEIKQLNSLKDIVNTRLDLNLDKTAFIQRNNDKEGYKYIKYDEVKNSINALGTYLLNKLDLKGKKIALIGENSFEWYISFMAVICGVGIICPIDKNAIENDISQIINESDIDCIIYSESVKDKIYNIKEELDSNIIYINMNSNVSTKKELSLYKIIESGLDLIKKGNNDYINTNIDNESCSAILYTSSKENGIGIMLSHKNFCSNLYSCAGNFPNLYKYTCMSVLPISNTFEFVIDYLYMTAIGGTIGICSSLENFNQDIKIIKPDFMLIAPAIADKFNRIIEKQVIENDSANKVKVLKKFAEGISKLGVDFRRHLFSKVHENFGGRLKYIICGISQLDVELIYKLESYGFNFIQCYGLTEATALISSTSMDKYIPGTVGKAVDGVDIRIDLSKNVDENSNVGQVIVNGQNVMLGYFNAGEDSKKVLKKDWLYTGDLGYYDLRGNLVIIGRIENVIKIEDKQVNPEELEGLLNRLPLIEQSMVYARKNTKSKENIITARIRLDNEEIKAKFKDKNPTPKELYTFILAEIKRINRMMPSYKVIKEIEIKENDFSKSTNFKIRRKKELQDTNILVSTRTYEEENAKIKKKIKRQK